MNRKTWLESNIQINALGDPAHHSLSAKSDSIFIFLKGGQMEFWKSRTFWLLLFDFVGSVGGFVLQNYLPQYQQVVVLVVLAAQPLILYFLKQFTVDDAVKQAVLKLNSQK